MSKDDKLARNPVERLKLWRGAILAHDTWSPEDQELYAKLRALLQEDAEPVDGINIWIVDSVEDIETPELLIVAPEDKLVAVHHFYGTGVTPNQDTQFPKRRRVYLRSWRREMGDWELLIGQVEMEKETGHMTSPEILGPGDLERIERLRHLAGIRSEDDDPNLMHFHEEEEGDEKE